MVLPELKRPHNFLFYTIDLHVNSVALQRPDSSKGHLMKEKSHDLQYV